MTTHESLNRASKTTNLTSLHYLLSCLMVVASGLLLYAAAWHFGLAPASREEKELISMVIDNELTKNNAYVLEKDIHSSRQNHESIAKLGVK